MQIVDIKTPSMGVCTSILTSRCSAPMPLMVQTIANASPLQVNFASSPSNTVVDSGETTTPIKEVNNTIGRTPFNSLTATNVATVIDCKHFH